MRLIIFFSNCCCGANQGFPETLKCTIYPFLRIMTQKPRSELTNQDLRIISMTDFKVFEYNTSLVFFSCIYSKRPLKCLKQLKCGWFCVESLYSYHLWPFLIQPQSLRPLIFPSITADWHGLFFAVRPWALLRQADAFRVKWSERFFLGYVAEMHWPRQDGKDTLQGLGKVVVFPKKNMTTKELIWENYKSVCF